MLFSLITNQRYNFDHTLENQLTWCNRFITFNSKALLFTNWEKKCILMVKNLKLNHGKLEIDYL